VLPLPGHFRLQRSRVLGLGGHPGNALPPKTHRNAGALLESRHQAVIVVSRRNAECQEGIAPIGFDLRRQHPGGGPPCLASVVTRLDQGHAATAPPDLPGAGRTDCPAAHDYDVKGCWHSNRMKLFET
jgi:hypothetical protein